MLKKTVAAVAVGLMLTGMLAGCSPEDTKTDGEEMIDDLGSGNEVFAENAEETVASLEEELPDLNWDTVSDKEWTTASGSNMTTDIADEEGEPFVTTQYSFTKVGEADDDFIKQFVEANSDNGDWTVQDISSPEGDEEGNGKTTAYILMNDEYQVYAGALHDNDGITTISATKNSPVE